MQLTKLTMLGYISKVFLLAPFFIFGNFQDSIQIIDLENVVVKSTRINTTQKQAPLSVTLKSFIEDRNFSSQSSFSDFIKNTPGVFTTSSNNFSQDMRISIRGFGARSAFGIRGIKLIVDGIPETTPDGKGQLDNLPLGLLKSFEVLRGPSASLYGNASGGVIYLNTLDKLKDQKANFKTSLGAYGFQNYQLSTSLDNGKTVALIYANRIKSDGYRINSGFEQNLFNVKVNQLITANSTIQLQLNYTNSPIAEDSGGLTLEDTESSFSQARQRNLDYDTYESIDHFKTGIRWLQSWGSRWGLDLSLIHI